MCIRDRISCGLDINSIYYVEDTISFENVNPELNYVYLLNSLDSDTEHSKALYSNMTQILDTSLSNLDNSWKIPYDVNYIPSLGTHFNLLSIILSFSFSLLLRLNAIHDHQQLVH